jgi:hypothetical protein
MRRAFLALALAAGMLSSAHAAPPGIELAADIGAPEVVEPEMLAPPPVASREVCRERCGPYGCREVCVRRPLYRERVYEAPPRDYGYLPPRYEGGPSHEGGPRYETRPYGPPRRAYGGGYRDYRDDGPAIRPPAAVPSYPGSGSDLDDED